MKLAGNSHTKEAGGKNGGWGGTTAILERKFGALCLELLSCKPNKYVVRYD